MNRKLLTGGLALLMMAAVVPAAAYHIDGQFTPVAEDQIPPGPATTLSTSDWRFDTGLVVVICESEGLMDDINANPATNPGFGGLCYTGRNDATGLNAPGATPLLGAGCENNPLDASVPAAYLPGVGAIAPAPGPPSFFDFTTPPACLPAETDFTRLDACSLTISQRNAFLFGPFLAAGGCAGNDGVHGWFAQMGPISCLVAPAQALYFSELYAWWLFHDGIPPYSEGDPAGTQHRGSAALQQGGIGRRDAYHGHVTMFLDPPPVGASTDGSAVTSIPATPYLAAPAGPYPGGTVFDDCGNSPMPDPVTGAPSGPLFLGP